MISVVTCLKNRFQQFLGMLQSLILSDCDGVELIVIDFGSDDGDPALEMPRVRKRLPARVAHHDPPFNHNKGRNKGVVLATHDTVFQLDADMLIPVDMFERIRAAVKPGVVYFPECVREDVNGKIVSDPHSQCGYGMCAITKADWTKLGGWDERYVAWGYDDVDFKERVEKAGLIIVREEMPGLIHKYHPNTWEHRNRHTANPQAKTYMKEVRP